jgi:diaminopropionate ammonia-lyase
VTPPSPGPGVSLYVNHRPRQVPQVPDGPEPRAFHRTMPGYEPTPLVALGAVADRIGVGEVWMKDESWRLELPSFKILGGSWAVCRLVMQRTGRDEEQSAFPELVEAARQLQPMTLCTATDGNHGRGVARMARLLGFEAVVYVPAGTSPARIEVIVSEGAEVRIHPGDYDRAVAAAAGEAERHGWEVVADVAYPGYLQVPEWVMDGYGTIFAECDEQLGRPPTAAVVQAGVGGLAGAAVRHYLKTDADIRSAVVEPVTAACLLASARAGDVVSLEDSQGSAMAGLNCGTPSVIAWPYLQATVDAFVAIEDRHAFEAMRLLADAGVVSGESGAAGLSGLLVLAESEEGRAVLGLDRTSRVLLVNTEGATDPDSYQAIVGRPPSAVRSGS